MSRLANAILPAMRSRIAAQVPGLIVAYPAPRQVAETPILILGLGTGNLAGDHNQLWTDRIRGLLLVGSIDIPSAITAGDALIESIADAFDPDDLDGYKLGNLVNRCRLEEYELNGGIWEYGGNKYYGGPLWFGVKRHRFAGDA